jgi:uncharacterized cupin superfamily protein
VKKLPFSAVPEHEQRSPGGKFHSFYRNLSVALGGIRNAGTWGGGHPFDLQLRRVPPGASICPFHSHLGQWELFFVRSGEGTVRAGDVTTSVKTGEVFVHPPGEPHQLINTGAVDLEVLIVADNPPVDAFYYPDSDKWGLRPPGKYFRMALTDYFDGEEAPPPGPPPAAYQPSGSPPPPPLTPFAQRKLHVDVLLWEPWTSPKGKFRGKSKELSIALGAKRRTPVGLGGHPFDLELGRFAPGESGCPYHSHSSQWELFFILQGRGSVRTPQGTLEVQAGDLVLQEPGDAHQLRNTGTDELEYLLVADNPTTDIWHYPDSNKWGFNAPRRFFRTSEVDYWDGEE